MGPIARRSTRGYVLQGGRYFSRQRLLRECRMHRARQTPEPMAIYALPGMSEPRGRLAQCSVSLRAVLAASLGAHRKAQHARVCFAGGRYFSRQRQLRECRCSARSAKRLAESSLGNCMLGVWLCPSRSRAPGGTRGGTGCKGAHHRSRYSPFRTLVRSAPPNHGEVMRGPCQRKGIRSKRDQTPPRHSV